MKRLLQRINGNLGIKTEEDRMNEVELVVLEEKKEEIDLDE